MKICRIVLPLFVGFNIIFHAKSAWALYRQPMAITIIDWATALVLVLFTLYVFIKVKFASTKKFRISLGLVIFNSVILIGAYIYMFYIEKTVKGFESIFYLGIPLNILYYLWVFSIPISVFLISLLSNKAKKMVLCLLCLFIVFCATEISLNYYEINEYLSNIEQSDYQEFKDIIAIRNYLSASGVSALRFYPQLRTKKVLLAGLRSKSWLDRSESAISLRYLGDRSTTSALLKCIRNRDDSGKYNLECAITLEMLLSNDYSFIVYQRVREEYKKDPEKLFKRLERKAGEYNK